MACDVFLLVCGVYWTCARKRYLKIEHGSPDALHTRKPSKPVRPLPGTRRGLLEGLDDRTGHGLEGPRGETLVELGGSEPPQESPKYVPLPDAHQQPAALAYSTACPPGGG